MPWTDPKSTEIALPLSFVILSGVNGYFFLKWKKKLVSPSTTALRQKSARLGAARQRFAATVAAISRVRFDMDLPPSSDRMMGALRPWEGCGQEISHPCLGSQVAVEAADRAASRDLAVAGTGLYTATVPRKGK